MAAYFLFILSLRGLRNIVNMAAATRASIEARMPQEPLPVPAMDDIGPVPILGSPDSQSFVVIKSAADLDELLDDNELSDISLLQEHKQILQEELAQFELMSAHHHPQPSLAKETISLQSTTNNNISLAQETDPPLADDSSLNEPQSSNETIKASTSASDLNQSVLPALPQPELCNGVNADDHDHATISIVSFAPSDFGSEEIQAKVSQLIEENIHLKNTILQNNSSMKTQYDRIVVWQKDVERVHEAHKEKFREAKKCIDTLRQENANLKQEMDNLRYSLQIQRTEHDKTKQLLTESSDNNLKEFELDVANNKIKQLEGALHSLTIKNGANLASETAKWKAMEDKLLRYEKELENAYKQIREFEKGAGEQQRAELGKIKVTQERLLLSEMANESANKEIVSLRTQLARTMQMADGSSKLQAALEQATADLEARNATLIDTNLRCSKFEERLQEANNIVRQHEEAAKCCRDKEEQAKIEAWRAKQKLAEFEQKYDQLQKSLEGAARQAPHPPQYVPDFNPGELAFIRQQLMQSQKALIESEQNRAVANAQMLALHNENAELRRQLDAKQNDSDDTFALRAQLDVYKADFEAEREAKEESKRDKNKIAEDLQHLSRRNTQMQEEIELMREQLKQYVSVPHSRPDSGRNQSPGGREQYSYKCPKCSFGFRTLNAVENHVVRCIDLDDSIP